MKRLAFNFYRSYYDIALELPEEERLPYLMAILDMQFNGNIQTDLKGMAKFAFISQMHSLTKQLEGYKSGINGGRPLKGTNKGIKTIPHKGTHNQEKEKGEDKVQEQVQVQEKVQGEEDGREKDLQTCISIALKDEKWLRLNSTNKKELDRFALKLQTEGIYSKLPIDFKTHFSRWKKKMPHELQDESIKPKRLYAQDFDTEAEYQTYLKSIA